MGQEDDGMQIRNARTDCQGRTPMQNCQDRGGQDFKDKTSRARLQGQDFKDKTSRPRL
jgi:hypothetical protein